MPAWTTENDWPLMSIDPVRCIPVVFASNVNCTVPFPLPFALVGVTVIHGAPLTAVHAQPAPAVTVTMPDPLVTGAGCVVGVSAIWQPFS